MARENRKAEKPLIVFLRLHGTEKKRMENVCRKFSTDHNAVAKAGMGAEMLRLELQGEGLTADMVAAIAEARAMEIDPVDTLRSAIAAKLSNL